MVAHEIFLKKPNWPADYPDSNAGNDTVIGTAQNNTIDGGNGDDVLSGKAGRDTLLGGGGNDGLRGGLGNDDLDGGPGDDWLVGEPGNDILKGGSGNDVLKGRDGNDLLEGAAGSDNLDGGAGSDVLRGGAGIDNLNGAEGNDQLFGSAGDDFLSGDAGNDTLYGGDGSDVSHYSFDSNFPTKKAAPAAGLNGNDKIIDFSFSSQDQLILSDLSADDSTLPALDASGEVTVATVGTDQADVLISFAGGGSILLDNILTQKKEDVDSLMDINKVAGYQAIEVPPDDDNKADDSDKIFDFLFAEPTADIAEDIFIDNGTETKWPPEPPWPDPPPL